MNHNSLKHPMTRDDVHALDHETLRGLHLQIFDKPTGDNIKRRLSLKIFRELERQYLDGRHVSPPEPEDVTPWDNLQPFPESLETAGKTCPRCRNTKPVGEGFGFRTDKGVRRPQSWCLACRGRKQAKEGATAR